MFRERKLRKELVSLMEDVRIAGLSEKDYIFAKELFEAIEYGECFDIIITQLYEYTIAINNEIYTKIVSIGEKMNFPEKRITMMQELIKDVQSNT